MQEGGFKNTADVSRMMPVTLAMPSAATDGRRFWRKSCITAETFVTCCKPLVPVHAPLAYCISKSNET